MKKTETIAHGGPAFPTIHTIDGNWVPDPRPEHMGMSLRDYFAAQALAGLLAENAIANRPSRLASYDVASRAYEMADAMLDARETDR